MGAAGWCQELAASGRLPDWIACLSQDASTSQHEATIPLEVLVVQSDASGLFHKTVHIARRSAINGGVAEVGIIWINYRMYSFQVNA
jgi:hypothetical protein